MKTKILLLATLFLIISCSSSDSASDNQNPNGGQEPAVAMVTRIDNVLYNTPPQNGSNIADATGGEYGNTYFLLKGFTLVSSSKNNLIGNKSYFIKLALPKNNIVAGTYNFTSTIQPNSYYADFDITGVSPPENVITNSGFIKILNYNPTTKEVKGSFNFTTNDGIQTSIVSHTLVGNFDFILN